MTIILRILGIQKVFIMKRGVESISKDTSTDANTEQPENKKRKTERFLMPPLTIEELHKDPLTAVLSFLPAFKYIGKGTITTVSKKWKKIIEANNFFDKKSYAKMIAACLNDPEGVLY